MCFYSSAKDDLQGCFGPKRPILPDGMRWKAMPVSYFAALSRRFRRLVAFRRLLAIGVGGPRVHPRWFLFFAAAADCKPMPACRPYCSCGCGGGKSRRRPTGIILRSRPPPRQFCLPKNQTFRVPDCGKCFLPPWGFRSLSFNCGNMYIFEYR